MLGESASIKATLALLAGAAAAEVGLMADVLPIEIDPGAVLQWLVLGLIGGVAFFVRGFYRRSEGAQDKLNEVVRRLDRLETRLDVVCPLWSARRDSPEATKHLEDHHGRE